MILKFIVQEQGEDTKELRYSGDYTVKDLEKEYLKLIETEIPWYYFGTKPNGFITRKDSIKSIFLSEGKT